MVVDKDEFRKAGYKNTKLRIKKINGNGIMVRANGRSSNVRNMIADESDTKNIVDSGAV